VVRRGAQEALDPATDRTLPKRDGCEVTASPALWSQDHGEVEAQEGQIGQLVTKPGLLTRSFLTRTKTLETKIRWPNHPRYGHCAQRILFLGKR
jgi:hypothetical protein